MRRAVGAIINLIESMPALLAFYFQLNEKSDRPRLYYKFLHSWIIAVNDRRKKLVFIQSDFESIERRGAIEFQEEENKILNILRNAFIECRESSNQEFIYSITQEVIKLRNAIIDLTIACSHKNNINLFFKVEGQFRSKPRRQSSILAIKRAKDKFKILYGAATEALGNVFTYEYIDSYLSYTSLIPPTLCQLGISTVNDLMRLSLISTNLEESNYKSNSGYRLTKIIESSILGRLRRKIRGLDQLEANAPPAVADMLPEAETSEAAKKKYNHV